MRHPAVTAVGIPDPLGPPTRIVEEPPSREAPTVEASHEPDLRFAPGDFELHLHRGGFLLWPVGGGRRLRNEAARIELSPEGQGSRVDIRIRRVGLGWFRRGSLVGSGQRRRAGASELLFALYDPVRLDTISDPFRRPEP